MKLSRLKQVCEKSKTETRPMQLANCKKALKNYSFVFNVSMDDLQLAIEEYFKTKYNKIADVEAFQLTRTLEDKKGETYVTQRSYFYIEIKDNKKDDGDRYFLFSLPFSTGELEKSGINLLKVGFIKSCISPDSRSQIPVLEEDCNQIGWNCILYTMKKKIATKHITKKTA